MKGVQHVRKVYKTERGFMERLHHELGFSWGVIYDARDAVRRDGITGMSKNTEATVELRPDGYHLSAVLRLSRPRRSRERKSSR